MQSRGLIVASAIIASAVIAGTAVLALDAASGETLSVAKVISGAAEPSKIVDEPIAWNAENFAPPAPAVLTSQRVAATELVFVQLPAGWTGDWHPTPRRQFGVMVRGTMEIETQDGTARQFKPGDVFLLEDITPPGHRSRVVGDSAAIAALIAAPQAPQATNASLER